MATDQELLTFAKEALETVERDVADLQAQSNRFARALVDVLDGIQDHDLQSMTGLSQIDCDHIARVRAEAAAVLPVRF